jgi:hypothetical protein
MSLDKLIAGSLIIVPVAILLMVGGMITLYSGVTHVTTGKDLVKVAGNFSQMLLRIAGYVVALLAIQYWIGLRPTLGW